MTTTWVTRHSYARPYEQHGRSLTKVATCPRCGGFLHERHRCRGLWKRRARSVVAMLGGAILSTLVLYTISGDPQGWAVVLSVLVGMIVGEALRAAATRR